MQIHNFIDKNYDNLTFNDRKILKKIMENINITKQLKSEELAKYCNVSRTTINRLLKKLGINSFAMFRLLLNEEDNINSNIILKMDKIINQYHKMIDDIKKIDYTKFCQSIYEADKIYIYGTGNEQKSIAEEMKRKLLQMGKYCIDVYDYGETAFCLKDFKQNDLFIIISLSGENHEGIKVIKLVNQSKIQKLSITKWNNNTIARLCDINLYVGTKKVGQKQNYEIVAIFYVLIDFLLVNYLNYRKQKMREL